MPKVANARIVAYRILKDVKERKGTGEDLRQFKESLKPQCSLWH